MSHRCAGGHRGSCRCAGRCCAGRLHGGHHRVDRRCGGGRRENCWCVGHHRVGCSCVGRQYGDHWRAGCRRGRGHERAGRCSRQKRRATRPGRPGRSRCGTNPACSPASHPTGCCDPGCRSGHYLSPGLVTCLNPGVADPAHCYGGHWHVGRWTCWAVGPCFQPRCFLRRHRTALRLHRWNDPDRYSQRDPGQHRWNGPGPGGHPSPGSGLVPRHRYGPGHPGRPDPARLPRSCSTLS